jgi:hypothetical protein
MTSIAQKKNGDAIEKMNRKKRKKKFDDDNDDKSI